MTGALEEAERKGFFMDGKFDAIEGRGEAPRLFHVYAQGNFIEATDDTPYFQLGESKYGKPILDRALTTETPLDDAVKLGLISFDSTVRSNVAVGPPFDLITLERDALKSDQRRIEAEDPYFRELGARWSQALADAHRAMPAPPWMTDRPPGLKAV